FKHDAARLATVASERVRRAGAANTLTFLPDGSVHADNTDGLGLVADIVRNAGVALAGRDVLLVGAGGAAAGVLAPLLEQGPRRIVVVNRTAARAQALVQAHADLAAARQVALQALPIEEPGTGFDVVVNATASSLAGGEIPVPGAVLREGT
ncbi:shikimate dehydrogenase, partial [Bacillus cereus]|nr:shikimate dehydrogenase [Bacillus cereus]